LSAGLCHGLLLSLLLRGLLGRLLPCGCGSCFAGGRGFCCRSIGSRLSAEGCETTSQTSPTVRTHAGQETFFEAAGTHCLKTANASTDHPRGGCATGGSSQTHTNQRWQDVGEKAGFGQTCLGVDRQ
jgi:hypothetical protein